jgi:hypothetical protein
VLREFARLVAEERALLVLEHVVDREHFVDGLTAGVVTVSADFEFAPWSRPSISMLRFFITRDGPSGPFVVVVRVGPRISLVMTTWLLLSA